MNSYGMDKLSGLLSAALDDLESAIDSGVEIDMDSWLNKTDPGPESNNNCTVCMAGSMLRTGRLGVDPMEVIRKEKEKGTFEEGEIGGIDLEMLPDDAQRCLRVVDAMRTGDFFAAAVMNHNITKASPLNELGGTPTSVFPTRVDEVCEVFLKDKTEFDFLSSEQFLALKTAGLRVKAAIEQDQEDDNNLIPLSIYRTIAQDLLNNGL